MGRPPVLGESEKEQIRLLVRAGKTNKEIFEFGRAHGWIAGLSTISVFAKSVREELERGGGEVGERGAARGLAEVEAELADLRNRVRRLEAVLAAPLKDSVKAEEVLVQTLAALRRHVARPDLEPRALALISAQIVEVTRALQEVQGEVVEQDLFDP